MQQTRRAGAVVELFVSTSVCADMQHMGMTKCNCTAQVAFAAVIESTWGRPQRNHNCGLQAC
jgi:hypothetical protein